MENQQEPKSYILSQSNLDNLVRYLGSQQYQFSDPILKFLQSALAPVDEKAALDLVNAEKAKVEENKPVAAPRRTPAKQNS